MNLDLSPGAAVNAGSGALLVVLGILVLRVQPRRPATTALGLFTVTFGYTWIPQNLIADAGDPLSLALLATIPASLALASGLLVLVALRFPVPVHPPAREVRLAAAAAGPLLLLAAAQVVRPELEPGVVALGPVFTGLYVAFVAAQSAFFAATIFGAVLLALRWGPLGSAPHGRANAAAISAALLLWPGTFAGARLLGPPSGLLASGALYLAGALVVAALWLRHARAAERPESRWARDLALLAVGTPALGLALALAVGGAGPASALPHLGLARSLGVALLAYAILRRQLLGIDLKVRWTVQRGTVAAVFVGVFFVVSEGTEMLFAQLANSEWVGLAAAGVLTFAMAPLERVAKRFAEAAIPMAEPDHGAAQHSGVTSPGKEGAYRAALHRVLADGRMSHADEAELAHLAAELGLPPRRAEELRREAGAGPRPPRARARGR